MTLEKHKNRSWGNRNHKFKSFHSCQKDRSRGWNGLVCVIFYWEIPFFWHRGLTVSFILSAASCAVCAVLMKRFLFKDNYCLRSNYMCKNAVAFLKWFPEHTNAFQNFRSSSGSSPRRKRASHPNQFCCVFHTTKHRSSMNTHHRQHLDFRSYRRYVERITRYIYFGTWQLKGLLIHIWNAQQILPCYRIFFVATS